MATESMKPQTTHPQPQLTWNPKSSLHCITDALKLLQNTINIQTQVVSPGARHNKPYTICSENYKPETF